MPGAVAYLVAYTVTLLTAFGIVTFLSTSDADAADLEHYRGLFWRRPMLAGIPATMGFIGKFYILASGANASA